MIAYLNLLLANFLLLAIYYFAGISFSLFVMLQFCSSTSLIETLLLARWWWDIVLGFFGEKTNFHIESKQKTTLPVGKSIVTIMLVDSFFLVVVVQSVNMFLIELVCMH